MQFRCPKKPSDDEMEEDLIALVPTRHNSDVSDLVFSCFEDLAGPFDNTKDTFEDLSLIDHRVELRPSHAVATPPTEPSCPAMDCAPESKTPVSRSKESKVAR